MTSRVQVLPHLPMGLIEEGNQLLVTAVEAGKRLPGARQAATQRPQGVGMAGGAGAHAGDQQHKGDLLLRLGGLLGGLVDQLLPGTTALCYQAGDQPSRKDEMGVLGIFHQKSLQCLALQPAGQAAALRAALAASASARAVSSRL